MKLEKKLGCIQPNFLFYCLNNFLKLWVQRSSSSVIILFPISEFSDRLIKFLLNALEITYLQLLLRQWGAGNVYLLVLSSWKVNIAENSIAIMGL